MWAMTVGQKPLLHLSPMFSPSVPVVNTEELKDRMISPLKSYLVHILSPGTKPRRRPGVFSLGHNHESVVYFFPLWWKNDGFAFLKHSCWLIHGTQRGRHPRRAACSLLFLSQSQGLAKSEAEGRRDCPVQ